MHVANWGINVLGYLCETFGLDGVYGRLTILQYMGLFEEVNSHKLIFFHGYYSILVSMYKV